MTLSGYFGNQFGSFFKVKIGLGAWLKSLSSIPRTAKREVGGEVESMPQMSQSTPRHLLKRNENMPHKDITLVL
jgi:hypothetical protein